MRIKKIAFSDLPSENANRVIFDSNRTYLDFSTFDVKCQEKTPEKEIIEKFEPKKLQSELLAYSYKRLGFDSKANRVIECGTFLEWARIDEGAVPGVTLVTPGTPSTGTNWRLHKANFCRDRLCPMCSWRRSYKIFGQISQIMDCIGDKYAYLFLTLTVPNCSPDMLSSTLDGLQKAWNKFYRYKQFKMAVRGFFKALEVTRNLDTGSYHPHFHVVLAVPKSYFVKDIYISRDDWLEMWQKATKNKRITQVDIRRAKQKKTKEGQQAVKALSSAVAEIAKYAVKSSDYIIGDDSDLMDKIVSELTPALSNRRLCAFGGVFDEVRKKLALDDVEDGDLVHIDRELNSDVAIQILRYSWSCGVYKLVEVIEK